MEKLTAPKIIWAAGENSGDLLASEVLPSVARNFPSTSMEGIGGDRMISAGLNPTFHARDLSVRGYVEVIKQLPRILRIRSQIIKTVKNQHPQAYIGIDAPDFNLSIEEKARKAGVPVIHMVAPAIWAWRPQRIHQIKRAVDHLLLIFPFEEEIFRKAGIPCTYIGHPLARHIPMKPDTMGARQVLGVAIDGAPVVAVLPGSRRDEIKWNSPSFFGACELILKSEPRTKFIIPAADEQIRQMINKELEKFPAVKEALTITEGQSHKALEAADAVLVASGTATLEAALYKKPMVVGYVMPGITSLMILSKAQSRWISLPNILSGKTLVPECVQVFSSPEILASHVLYALEPRRREELEPIFTDMHASLLRDTPALASEAVLKVLKQD
ncbi:MAG: lipid-A-disaccharide synthase [Burkholderiales bacterium]|nr:lipid-A-disaccharide synthase [Burkholderiales bacterium]